MPAEPLLFLKPPSSVIGDGEAIVLPQASERVEFEGELAVVIGRRITRVPPAEAMAAVSGIAALNDVTARDLQRRDGQWTRAKGFDTFCAVGNVAPVPDDLAAASVVTRVNGVERQRGRVSDMVFTIPDLVSYISGIMTLEPGDLIATGTPAGVGPLTAGDVVEVEISGLSRVSNPVRGPE